jgi:hypothetical protein
MDGEQLLDEKTIVARIRERLRGDISQTELPSARPRQDAPLDLSPRSLDAELEAMAAAADIGNVPSKSYRRFFGPLLSLFRKFARKIMGDLIEQQVAYNLANYRLTRALRLELESLRAGQERSRREAEEKPVAPERREADRR